MPAKFDPRKLFSMSAGGRNRRRTSGQRVCTDASVLTELLESRRLLTGVDPDDQAAEAPDYGDLSTRPVSIDGFISTPKDVDVIRFDAVEGQRISAVLTSMSNLLPRLRLFGPSGFSNHPSTEELARAFEGQRLDYVVPESGTYYLGVSELDNDFYNIRTGGFDKEHPRATTGSYRLTFADTAPKADLVGIDFSAESTADKVRVSFDVENTGGASAGGFDVDIYASTNDLITRWDRLLTTVRVPGLATGGVYSVTDLEISLPDGYQIPEEGAYIGIVIDGAEEITEEKESNNSSVGSGRDYELVLPPASADLVGSDFDVIKTHIRPGESTRVDYRIRNEGESESGAFQVSFYASVDSEITTSDTLLDRVEVPSIPANDSTGLRPIWLRLPNDFASLDDAFSIGMIIDSLDEIAESNESNNRGVGSGLDTDSVVLVGSDPPGIPELTVSNSYVAADVALTWSNVNADRYEVWVTSLDTNTRVLHDTNVTTTGIDATGLLGRGRYRIWVRAANGEKWSGWSAGFQFNVQGDGGPPQRAIINMPNRMATQDLRFSWGAISNADGYELWVSSMSTRQRVLHETNVATSEFSFANRLSAGGYRVWVRGFNAEGWGAWSTGFRVTVTGDGVVAPDAPQLTTTDRLPETNATFTWEHLSNADRYELWISDVSTGQRVVHRTDLTEASFAQDMQRGKYRVWVRAANAAGWGAWSAAMTVNIGSAPEVAPEITMHWSANQDDLSFEWTEVADADFYEVWVNDVQTGSRAFHRTRVTENRLFAGGELATGDYNVWVRAGNAAGWSGWSEVLTVTVVKQGNLPSPEFGPSPLQGSTYFTAAISWQHVPGADQYQVELRGINTDDQSVATGTVSTASVTVQLRENGFENGIYQMRVRLIQGDTFGEWSDSLEFYFFAPFTLPDYDGWLLGHNTN